MGRKKPTNPVLWYVFLGSRGGENRANIMRLLLRHPYNAHQLCKELSVDYKTILHHLRVLEENRFVVAITDKRYSKAFSVTPEFLAVEEEFGEIWEQFGNKPI